MRRPRRAPSSAAVAPSSRTETARGHRHRPPARARPGAREALHRHRPHAGHGRRAAGELRPSGHADGPRAARVPAVDAPPALRPEGSGLDGSRPVRAVGRPRVDAALLGALPERLRPRAGRPEAVPAVGEPHARAPGVRLHARRRDDDRPARPGRRQRGRLRGRGGAPRGDVQPRRARDPGPPHVVHLRRRRPDGRRVARGGVLRGAQPAREADRLLRRQPDHDRGAHEPHVQRRRREALRGLRLARAARRGRQRPRGARRGDRAGEGGDGPAVARHREVASSGSAAPNRADSAKAHGEPLGKDEIRLTKQAYGWPSDEPFFVPDDALQAWRAAGERSAQHHTEWTQRWDAYRAAHPDLAAELERRFAKRLPDGWDADIQSFTTENGVGRQPRGERRRAERGRGAAAGADRRLGGSRGLDQHAAEGRSARSGRTTTRAATSTSASASTAWAR